MFLQIIGSGTCVPSLKRGSPATYIKIGQTQILVDIGPGTLRQLERAGISYQEINIVCITHYHADHISDLVPFIQALKWNPNFLRTKELLLIGPPGFNTFYQTLCVPISGNPLPDTFTIAIKEIQNSLVFANFSIQSYKTNHTPDSIAYKFLESGNSLVISGDTDFDNGLIGFSQNSDLLVLECSFDNLHKKKGHLIPKECAEIAQKAQVKKLLLNHLYPAI